MADVLIIVGVLAVTLWAGVSLLRETDLPDEVVGDLWDLFFYLLGWALALIAVTAIAAVVYLSLT